jgi:nicotinamidase-related amidase
MNIKGASSGWGSGRLRRQRDRRAGRGALDRDVGAGKTVVAMGTQAQTSVLHTAGAAALRGFQVIVPVDGMSADDVFPELYTAWHLATAARISPQVTLTKFDLIGF